MAICAVYFHGPLAATLNSGRVPTKTYSVVVPLYLLPVIPSRAIPSRSSLKIPPSVTLIATCPLAAPSMELSRYRTV